MSFAAATEVQRVDDTTFATEIRAGWEIAGNANGGYLLALLTRAVTEATGKPHPVAVSAHYLAPGRAGPATVDVEVARVGRRHATATATLRDAERALVVAVVTTADLGRVDPTALLVDASPPELPDPEECPGRPPGLPGAPGFMHQVDLRLHPEDVPFGDQVRRGPARVRGWFRLPDDEPIDPLALLVAVDGFPPTIFNAGLPVGWTPTLELTAHVRGVPAPGWLRCSFSTRFVTGGYLEEDGEVWDASGCLIAQSRQLALVPRPAPG